MLKLTDNYTLTSIDHMTHINNLEGILKNGLLAHNNPYQKVDISNRSVNSRRNKCEPIYRKNIHDYVPFYFNPRNAMLYCCQKNYGEAVIILGFNTAIMDDQHAIYTDGNAACANTHYFSSQEVLGTLQWDHIFSGAWYGDQQLKQQMMAEVLIHKAVAIDSLQYIFCQTPRVKRYIDENYELTSSLH